MFITLHELLLKIRCSILLNCKLVLQVKVQHNRFLLFEMVETFEYEILEVELKEDLGKV